MGSSIGLSRVSPSSIEARSIARMYIERLNEAHKNGLCTVPLLSPHSILIPKFQDYETISANKLAEFSSD